MRRLHESVVLRASLALRLRPVVQLCVPLVSSALVWVALVCVPLISAPPLGAQQGASQPDAASGQTAEQPAQGPAETYFEAVDVEIVNVDVWVTDKQGNHITGLTRDDFEVLRDGDPVPVANFYAVEEGRPANTLVESVGGISDAERPGDVGRPELPDLRSRPALPPEHRLWMILYIDNFNSAPLERNRTLPAIRHFLGETLRPGDQVMLVSFDRSLKIRQPFTDQVSVVFAELEEIYDDAGFAVIRRRERFDALERIDDATQEVSALSTALNFAESQMHEVEATADALQQLIETMGGLPGRKALVYLSSGVPMLAGEEAFQAVGEKFADSRAFSEIGRHDATRYFERVTRKANTHRVVFYTLDAGGNRGFQFGAAEYGDFVSPDLRRILDSVVVENLHSPLRLMADETGGRAILNRNEATPALEEVSRDLRTFYSLGISNTNASEGRYHQVEVRMADKALRKDYLVRHRTGYRSRSMDGRMDDSLRSGLLYGYEENSLGLQAQWANPEPYGEKHLYVMEVQLQIPLRDLVLLPVSGDKHELRLRLYVGVADERGDTSEIDHVPLGLRIDSRHLEAAKGESFVYKHKMLLSAGKKKVGVAVLDLVGRESAFLSRVVQVGPAEDIKVVDE